MDYFVLFIIFNFIFIVDGNSYKGYLGCFKDSSSDRILRGYSTYLSPNGAYFCTNICIDKGFRYAGTEYWYNCHCGHSIRYRIEGNNCNLPCTNNHYEFCGGDGGISIFDTWKCATEQPCKNGGTCSDINKDNYWCSCTEQWTGVDCSQVKTTTSSTTTSSTTITTTTQPTTTAPSFQTTDSDNMNVTTSSMKKDDDNKSGILMFVIIPSCVVFVIIIIIAIVIIYCRRKRAKGQTGIIKKVQHENSSKQTANVGSHNISFVEDDTSSNKTTLYYNEHFVMTAEGDHVDISFQPTRSSEGNDYNVLCLHGTNSVPVNQCVNDGLGVKSDNTYSHLHEVTPPSNDTYSHINSSRPNKVSSTQDNVYSHASQGAVHSRNTAHDNTYNTLTLPNTRDRKKAPVINQSLDGANEGDLYYNVTESFVTIQSDNYSHVVKSTDAKNGTNHKNLNEDIKFLPVDNIYAKVNKPERRRVKSNTKANIKLDNKKTMNCANTGAEQKSVGEDHTYYDFASTHNVD
ncbi:hypothetical protein ACF0H5_008002 [Mactra antiquata]